MYERLPNRDARDREKGSQPDLVDLCRYILMASPSPRSRAGHWTGPSAGRSNWG